MLKLSRGRVFHMCHHRLYRHCQSNSMRWQTFFLRKYQLESIVCWFSLHFSGFILTFFFAKCHVIIKWTFLIFQNQSSNEKSVDFYLMKLHIEWWILTVKIEKNICQTCIVSKMFAVFSFHRIIIKDKRANQMNKLKLIKEGARNRWKWYSFQKVYFHQCSNQIHPIHWINSGRNPILLSKRGEHMGKKSWKCWKGGRKPSVHEKKIGRFMSFIWKLQIKTEKLSDALIKVK